MSMLNIAGRMGLLEKRIHSVADMFLKFNRCSRLHKHFIYSLKRLKHSYILNIAWCPDRSKLFTPSPQAELFMPTPTLLLWEAFSHAALTAQRLFIHIFPPVYSQVLVYTSWDLSELGYRGEKENPIINLLNKSRRPSWKWWQNEANYVFSAVRFKTW